MTRICPSRKAKLFTGQANMFLGTYIFIFLFGLIVGSFLNCVVYRTELKEGMPKGRPRKKVNSFLSGRSLCPKCKHKLAWYDLIPIFSFIFLKAKCRYCKKKISWQYPLVELATGILFLLILNFQFSPVVVASGDTTGQAIFNFIYLLIVSCFLIVIFVFDLKHYIIPDRFVFPALGLAFVFQIFENWKLRIENCDPLLNLLFASLAGAGFFLLIWAVSRGRFLGFGDVKLAFLMGIFLGWPNILVALFSAFLIGAAVGLILIAQKKKKMKSEVPFGPFLVIGTFIGLFFGQKIINWYLTFLL